MNVATAVSLQMSGPQMVGERSEDGARPNVQPLFLAASKGEIASDDSEQSAFDSDRFICHASEFADGNGRPQAPSLIIPRSAAKEFPLLERMVDRCPRGTLEIFGSSSFEQKGLFPEVPSHNFSAVSCYNTRTSISVVFKNVRLAADKSSLAIGVGTAGPATTFVTVHGLLQNSEKSPFPLLVSTDAYDAGLYLVEDCATLTALRPKAAGVWFLVTRRSGQRGMRSREQAFPGIDKTMWSVSRTQRAFSLPRLSYS